MTRSTLVLGAALAGVALLSGCGTESAITPVAGSAPAPVSTVATPGEGGGPAGTRSAVRARETAATNRPSNALNWGQPSMSNEDLDRAVRAVWADKHGVRPSAVVGEQLLLGLADGGNLLVGAYQLWAPGGRAHVVVAQGGPRSEAVLVSDRLARPDAPAVAAVVSRRTAEVVASVAPGTTRVEYRQRSGAAWTAVDQDSLDLVFRRGPSAGPGEALRTTRAGRQSVTVLTPASTTARPAPVAAPANVVSWPARGSAASGPSTATVARAYAKAMGAPSAEVKRLFSGDTDSGVRYLVGQAWVPGKPAQTVGYVVRPGREGELHIQPVTRRGTRLVALLVSELPGTTTDLLVVVPEPRTTQVSYRTSSTSRWRPAYTDQRLDGVSLVDRATAPADDALQLMTGNGDPDAASTLVVRVSKALCDGPSCS